MGRKAWRLGMVVLSLLPIFLLLAGCAGQKVENQGVYTIADTTGDWGFPSPYGHYPRGPGYVRMSFIFDTLIWKDAQGFVPALAREWQYDPQDNAYIFHLNQNVTWHDGHKFTSKDVVFTVDYMRKHPYQWVDTSVIKKAEALDEYTVKLGLSKPYAPFLSNIAGTLPILPAHIWQNVEEPEKFQQKEAVIGTGPFKLVDYNREQGTYLYEAYDNYYQGKPRVSKLKFVKISEEMAAAAIRQKQVNAASPPPELTEDLKKEGFKILRGTHDWVAKLLINHRKGPLSKREFRQALALAIDREALVKVALRGFGLAGSPGLIPPDNPWYNARVEQYNYNPSKAEELLASLGYTRQRNYLARDGQILELELLFRGTGSRSSEERVAELVKEQLEKVGIKVNLRSLEAKTLDNRVKEWKFDLALSGHGGLGGDPEILNRVISGQGFNSARYDKSEELNSLLAKQNLEMDLEKRRQLVNQIQEIYAREMPALPLYYPTSYWAHDGRIELYFTPGGVGSGVPNPLNKMAFVK
ncbi:peptide/nickel transport system substrate-binding protein [Thermanaeromonas toyohensis ToBE]|uniref:Peptide/nickel transport system substrate-binding protein n=1 Tax=Thermanaeromonas toyohensis ToBE TaxID=698762 RepID=A0A1W1W244_9FIRM|nr:ABC transporter substrate-binding protein [Thermanaeromonas toyohensis]SMB99656.1 peptide/nickel transport system substrate-binding protein [Thermanaeromonas toyohensis ToBE]